MNVRGISNDGLRQVVHEWLERGSERRAIVDRDPLLRANVEHLEEARDTFARLAPVRSPASEAENQKALDQIDRQIAEVDHSFDQPARAACALLDAAVVVAAEDEVMTARLLAVRAALYPRGLVVTTLKPAEEAGAALAIEEALDDETRSLLAHLTFKVGSLQVSGLSLVEQQIAAGKKLGKLVARRDSLASSQIVDEPDEHTQTSALVRFGQARNLIVAAVNDFVRDIERARSLSSAERALLLATVSKLSPRSRTRKLPTGGDSPASDGA